MNYRPPVGYHFVVSFLPKFAPGNLNALDKTAIEANFKEVSGLTVELPVEKFQEGGVNDYQHPLPKPATSTNISLKRGLLVKSELGDWLTSSIESFSIEPKDIVIMLLGPEGKVISAWHVMGAFPVKWDISGFNSMDNAIVIESIDFTCRRHKRISVDGVKDRML